MLNPEPEALACVMVTEALPPLERVMGWELLLPVTTLPKLTLVGFAESCG